MLEEETMVTTANVSHSPNEANDYVSKQGRHNYNHEQYSGTSQICKFGKVMINSPSKQEELAKSARYGEMCSLDCSQDRTDGEHCQVQTSVAQPKSFQRNATEKTFHSAHVG